MICLEEQAVICIRDLRTTARLRKRMDCSQRVRVWTGYDALEKEINISLYAEHLGVPTTKTGYFEGSEE